ncbi:MAG: diacylglycerol/lipid kinase family protein [Salibacteraceae bacterium]
MNEEWYFVVNPKSGKGKGLMLWQEIQPLLQQSNIPYAFDISNYHQHTISLVNNQYKKGGRKFIGLGGDGTINEIVNGIFQAQKFTLANPSIVGLIPVGTGNDWVRNHQPLTSTNIIERLKTKKYINHDVGVVKCANSSNHYFINVAGCGLDGAVTKEIGELAQRDKKNKLSYLSSTIKALINFKAPNAVIQVENQLVIQGKTLLAAASIGKYFGGGMLISPKAHFSNGTLNFTVVKDDSKWVIFPQLYKLFNGKIENVSFVEKRTGNSIQINTDMAIPVQADGENLGTHKKIGISVLKHAIQVLS